MTLKDIRSDIQLIAQRSKISKDERLWDEHINYLIHKYRARGIRESFTRQQYIDPVWIQDIGNRELTVVDAAEEISVSCSIKLGKATLPRVLSIEDDKGVVRVTGTNNQKSYHLINYQRFFDLDQSSLRAKFDYTFRIGDAFYLTNPPTKAGFKLVLDNPMDGDFFDNTIQETLKQGMTYKVESGTISYNGTSYLEGSSFTASLATTFSGPGKVYFLYHRRPMTEDDPYPMTFQLGEYVSMMILTKELEIERRQIPDVKNNNAEDATIANTGAQKVG